MLQPNRKVWLTPPANGDRRWHCLPTADAALPAPDNLDPTEGTIEMWVALRADGSDPVYSSRSHTLFHYRVHNDNWLGIAQARHQRHPVRAAAR